MKSGSVGKPLLLSGSVGNLIKLFCTEQLLLLLNPTDIALVGLMATWTRIEKNAKLVKNGKIRPTKMVDLNLAPQGDYLHEVKMPNILFGRMRQVDC